MLVDQVRRADEAEGVFDILVVIDVHLNASMRVATESDRGVVVVFFVVELAKVHTAAIDCRHSVSREAMVALQVACVRRAVSLATIDQMSNAHISLSSGGVIGDAGQVRQAGRGQMDSPKGWREDERDEAWSALAQG